MLKVNCFRYYKYKRLNTRGHPLWLFKEKKLIDAA